MPLSDQLCGQCQGPTSSTSLRACPACRHVQLSYVDVSGVQVERSECTECNATTRALVWCQDCEVYFLGQT